MYNLIVIGYSDNSWFDDCEILIHKNRYLEYTEEDIHKIFNDDIEKASKMPCFIMQEGNNPEIHLCKISNVKIESLNYKVKFEIVHKNLFTLDDINIEEFEIADFERSRTHWAIKDVDLLDVIESNNFTGDMKATIEDYLNQFDSSLNNIKLSVGSILDINLTTDEDLVKSVNDFIKKIINTDSKEQYINFYRGHSDISYKLEPSLFRKNTNGSFLYLEQEQKIYNELLTENFNEFSSDNTTFDRLVRMQHFSSPTRLLDISTNPLIALYFACKGGGDKNGDVILIQIPDSEVKYFDSDTATCIANLCKLSNKEKENLLLEDKGNSDYKNTKKRLVHYIKGDKPYFIDYIKDGDLNKVLCIKGKLTNTRINAQSGAFLLFGHDSILEDTNTFKFNINHFIIDKESKEDILNQLDLLNINESTLFPNLESNARYISNKYKNE